MFTMESLRSGLVQILVDKNNDDWLTFTEEEVRGLLRMLRAEPSEEQVPKWDCTGSINGKREMSQSPEGRYISMLLDPKHR